MDNPARRQKPAGAPGAPGSDAPEVVQGTLERVTYHDEQSLFSVLQVQPERGMGDPDSLFQSRLTAVGLTSRPSAGQRVRLLGHWGEHATHGRRFQFALLEALPPIDRAGLEKYLASDAFPGIGPTLADRIVSALGTGALEIIRERPEALEAVAGLRPPVRDELVARVREELGAHQAHAFLLGLGLGPGQTRGVIRSLGSDCEERVRKDPYLIASAVPGLGFLTADRIARNLGLAEDAPQRLCAALCHTLEGAANDGHTCLAEARLLEEAGELLRGAVETQLLSDALEGLAQRRDVVLHEQLASASDQRGAERLVYLPPYFTSEEGLAANLSALLQTGERRPLASAEALAEAEGRSEIVLHPRQREAVLGLLSTPVGVLTGGPGVGKTTIVRLVVELAEAAGARVLLASPTGRAAKRLSEAAGREAATIHRLLGYQPGQAGFARNEREPLEADLVVVDEVSMLDVVLAHHLLKALQPPTRLVLVGDPDQLPSVGAGNVLGDLLESRRAPSWRLTEVYRQVAESGIVMNAHRILRGEWPEFTAADDSRGDFYWFPANDEDSAASRVVEVVCDRIPNRFGVDWVRDVQVLAPMYKGECGVDRLNEKLRQALGQGGHELEYRGRLWRTGDRVIHTRNDYERELFNGDMGRIASIAADGSSLLVSFPDKEVAYRPEDLGNLQPAFAITVHRAQGSEYPCVVLPLLPRHHLMLQRHLLYTAITRARQLVVIVGARRAIERAIATAEARRRESALAERLRALLPEAADHREC